VKKRDVINWIEKRLNKQVLLAFSIPKTPRHVERKLLISKLNLKPFLEKGLLNSLNPEAKKGRFYIVTSKARRLLKLPCSKNDDDRDWGLIGWVISSPRQRLAVLRAVDLQKLTSEEIRARTTQLNANISRTSIKGILKELLERNLIDTEVLESIRFYWLNQQGMKIKQDLAVIAPLSALFSPA